MSTWSRFKAIFLIKSNKLMDRVEDPREGLDYAYQQQLELLQQVRRGVAEVATARKRLELQLDQLKQQADKLESQSRQALGVGREDLAREALTRREAILAQITDLEAQLVRMRAEEEKIGESARQLQVRVEAFRTKKETIKATYSAAQAQNRVAESFSGLSRDMNSIAQTIQRAEDKTLELSSRASAIDELLASGALDDPTGATQDALTRELAAITGEGSVDRELARIRGEITAGPPSSARSINYRK